MPLLQDLWNKYCSKEAKLLKTESNLEKKKRELDLTKRINILNQEVDEKEKEIQVENDKNLVKHNTKKENKNEN